MGHNNRAALSARCWGMCLPCPALLLLLLRKEAKHNNQIYSSHHISGFLLSLTDHTAGDWPSTQTGRLCTLSKEPAGVHPLMIPKWYKMK